MLSVLHVASHQCPRDRTGEDSESQNFLFHFLFISNIYKDVGTLGTDRNGTPAPSFWNQVLERERWFFEHQWSPEVIQALVEMSKPQ